MAGKSRGKLKGSTSVYRSGHESFGNNEQGEASKNVWDNVGYNTYEDDREGDYDRFYNEYGYDRDWM